MLSRGRGLFSAASAMVLCAGLAIGAGSAAASLAFSTPPEIPTPPHVKFPTPDQSAIFEVIVEGTATDTLQSHLSGQSGPCLVTEDGKVEDLTTYRRGKGVQLEFDRYGKTIVIHRVGRLTDSSLAVQARTERTATGGTTFTPALNFLPCTIAPTHLADNPDCGKTFAETAKMLFAYKEGSLELTLSHSTTAGSVGPKDNTCGDEPATGITDPFSDVWPLPPPLERSPQAPPGTIFGHRHVIVVHMASSDRGIPKTSNRNFGSSALSGNTEESAFNRATVRLIRQK